MEQQNKAAWIFWLVSLLPYHIFLHFLCVLLRAFLSWRMKEKPASWEKKKQNSDK